MSEQLAFPLPNAVAYNRANLIVTPANTLVLTALADWRHWPDGKMALIGPEGSGKSHLAAIWAEETEAEILPASALTSRDLPALSRRRLALVVEDCDRIAGDEPAETALFHLHNLMLPEGRLLVTAKTPARDWGLILPDLLSRLQAAPVALLERPDDRLLQGVLEKLFADRQLNVPPTLIPWLLPRMPRSIGAARTIVAMLDARALAERRPLGLRLAAEVLAAVLHD